MDGRFEEVGVAALQHEDGGVVLRASMAATSNEGAAARCRSMGSPGVTVAGQGEVEGAEGSRQAKGVCEAVRAEDAGEARQEATWAAACSPAMTGGGGRWRRLVDEGGWHPRGPLLVSTWVREA